jgi:hypothetical protein
VSCIGTTSLQIRLLWSTARGLGRRIQGVGRMSPSEQVLQSFDPLVPLISNCSSLLAETCGAVRVSFRSLWQQLFGLLAALRPRQLLTLVRAKTQSLPLMNRASARTRNMTTRRTWCVDRMARPTKTRSVLRSAQGLATLPLAILLPAPRCRWTLARLSSCSVSGTDLVTHVVKGSFLLLAPNARHFPASGLRAMQ